MTVTVALISHMVTVTVMVTVTDTVTVQDFLFKPRRVIINKYPVTVTVTVTVSVTVISRAQSWKGGSNLGLVTHDSVQVFQFIKVL
jgi:hypothetical protein